MGTPVVRVRTDADLPAAAAALVQVHETDGYPVEGVEQPVMWLVQPPPLRAWVADAGSQLVGHVALSEPGPGDAAAPLLSACDGDERRPVILGRLFVVRSARGGLGAQLLDAATSYARSLGRRVVLDVMEKDVAAIRLYERAGWRCIGSAEHDAGSGRTVPARCYVSPP